MNIGIDLDGVVFDTESYYRAYSDYFDYEKNLNRGKFDRKEARVQRRFDWAPELLQQFFDEYMFSVQEEAPFLPLAREILAELKKRGHRLVLITSRGVHGVREIEIAKERLSRAGIQFDASHYSVDDKLSVCIQEKIDIMIDDYYDIVENLSKNGVACVFFRDNLLKFCERPNVIDVDNWGQVMDALDKLEAKISG